MWTILKSTLERIVIYGYFASVNQCKLNSLDYKDNGNDGKVNVDSSHLELELNRIDGIYSA